jgi:hypothetical protein
MTTFSAKLLLSFHGKFTACLALFSVHMVRLVPDFLAPVSNERLGIDSVILMLWFEKYGDNRQTHGTGTSLHLN